jgi:hypothetical protein
MARGTRMLASSSTTRANILGSWHHSSQQVTMNSTRCPNLERNFSVLCLLRQTGFAWPQATHERIKRPINRNANGRTACYLPNEAQQQGHIRDPRKASDKACYFSLSAVTEYVGCGQVVKTVMMLLGRLASRVYMADIDKYHSAEAE